jgi:hypothetical protein
MGVVNLLGCGLVLIYLMIAPGASIRTSQNIGAEKVPRRWPGGAGSIALTWSYPDPVDSLYYAASWTELTSSNCAGVM